MATFTTTGIQPRSLDEYVQLLHNAFRNALGQNLSMASETPQGQLAGTLALIFTEAEELALYVAAGLNLHTIFGRQVDDWGTLLGIPRIVGQRTTVDAVLTGTAGTGIPVGSLAADSNDNQYESVEDVLIPASGTVTTTFRSTTVGALTLAANDLTVIVSSVPGWDTINNPEPGATGRLTETTAEYVIRYSEQVAVHSRGSLESIKARILQQPGVVDCRMIENPTNNDVTVQSLDLPPFGYGAIVQGGIASDIAQAISDTRPAGTVPIGSRVVDIRHPEGFTIPIRYTEVELVPIRMAVEIAVEPGVFPSNGVTTIRQSLADWVSGTWNAGDTSLFDRTGLGIGEAVIPDQLRAPILSVPGHIITSIAVTLTTSNNADPPVYNPVPSPNLWQRFTLSSEDVIVTIA